MTCYKNLYLQLECNIFLDQLKAYLGKKADEVRIAVKCLLVISFLSTFNLMGSYSSLRKKMD